MFVRVVRFNDVDPGRLEALRSRMQSDSGPPPGVNSTGLRLLVDEQQRTAVVLQEFETAEDMAEAARILSALDASETPGTRVSVDATELRVDLRP
jgi:hypothetical protein